MSCYVFGYMPKGGGEDPSLTTPVEEWEHWPLGETMHRSWWSAQLTPLVASGKSSLEEDFKLAQDAGLDAFGVLMGPNLLPSQYSDGITAMAQVAETNRVKIFPDIWDDSDFKGSYSDRYRALGVVFKKFMDAHPGAFLKRDGRWVVSLGNPLDLKPTPSWEDFQPFFDAWRGPQKFYIIMNTSWHTQGNPPGDWDTAPDAYSMWVGPTGWGDPQVCVLPGLAEAYHKDVAWPVNASFFGGRRSCDGLTECFGISHLSDEWREAIRLKTAEVALQTWNDFSEDHALTETNVRGDTLIHLTRYFSDWARMGAPPPIDHERIMLFHHRQLVDAKLTSATIHSHNDQWHVAPTVDYLNVVTFLRSPAVVQLTVGGAHWELSAPAGMHEWLVYRPSPLSGPNPQREAYARPGEASYPPNSGYRTVTAISSIPPGKPMAAIVRGGTTVLSVSSRATLADSGQWEDLSLIGTETTQGKP